MAQAGTQLTWDTPIVVDKHCIGGIPGNRTSMIVVPIVAAHGLTIPKTSSRAITSPAGTADTMEVLARVDLSVDEMKEVVSGLPRLSGLGRPRQSVAGRRHSHFGGAAAQPRYPRADGRLDHVEKDRGRLDPSADRSSGRPGRQAHECAWRRCGCASCSSSSAITSASRWKSSPPMDASRSATASVRCSRRRTSWRCCANDPAAPADLREKSLRLAAHLLEYDPELRGGTGYARARELLDSGAALKQMQKIIDAQGPSGCRTDLGTLDRRHSGAEATASSRRSIACVSTAWRAPPARRSTRARASRSSRRSAIASRRASRSIASTHSINRNSTSRSRPPRSTPATSSARDRTRGES